VRVGGMTVVIRGQRPGEQPATTRAIKEFDGYSSHDEWGTDHFGFTYRGDLRAFCDELKAKGVRMAVEPWEFKPGMVLCYVSAPDGVSIELMQE
jgi:catechol 2,3-dioxygenase-like lactoylglutathione lyase family enzyme